MNALVLCLLFQNSPVLRHDQQNFAKDWHSPPTRITQHMQFHEPCCLSMSLLYIYKYKHHILPTITKWFGIAQSQLTFKIIIWSWVFWSRKTRPTLLFTTRTSSTMWIGVFSSSLLWTQIHLYRTFITF